MFSRASILCLAFALAPITTSAAPPSPSLAIGTPREFASIVIKDLLAARPELKHQPSDDPLVFVLVDATGKPVQHVDLTRVYEDYRTVSAADRHLVVERAVRVFRETDAKDETFAEAKARLRPIVRTGVELDAEEHNVAKKGDKAPSFPRRKVLGPLVVSLALDYPDSIRRVTTDDLTTWGVTMEAALEVALANIQAGPSPFREAKPGVWVAENGDGVDSGRILMTAAIRALKVRGDAIALVAARDFVMIVGSEDTAALEGLLAIGAKARGSGRGIAAPVVRLGPEGFAPWTPPATHPLAKEVALWNLESEAINYDIQKDVLQERLGEDVFVGSLMVGPGRDGAISMAVVTIGIVSFLPRAEHVVLIEVNQADPAKSVPLGFTTWTQFASAVGAKLVPQTYEPERFRFDAKLTKAELEKMGLQPLEALGRAE